MLPQKRLVPISDQPHSVDGPAASGSLVEPADDEGLSLEELSRSYQRALGGIAPQHDPAMMEDTDGSVDPANADMAMPTVADQPPSSDSHDFPLTPQSVGEAMLFFGRPDDQAVTTASIAAVIRASRKSLSELTQTIAKGVSLKVSKSSFCCGKNSTHRLHQLVQNETSTP